MPICFINPDGSHVRGCLLHLGDHPADWDCDRPGDSFETVVRRLAVAMKCTICGEPLLQTHRCRPQEASKRYHGY